MIRLAFLLLLLISQISAFTQHSNSEYSRVKIDLTTTDISVIAALGLEADHGVYVKGRHLINDFSSEEILALEDAGISFEVQIADVQEYYKERNRSYSAQSHTHAHSQTRLVDCNPTISNDIYQYDTPENYAYGSMGGYLTYDELLITLDNMASMYPNIISAKAPIGEILTHEGRPIYWLRLSDNPNTHEAEPEVLYTALHHAREPNSLSQMVFYLWYLLENYATDPEVQYLVDNTQMYFIPCVNPDGYIYNEIIEPDGGGLWRKNRYAQNGTIYGVDLNRNYGHEWGYDNIGSSSTLASQTYRGPSAFSEPETQAVRDFCNEHAFNICLNHHTYGNLLIYPWGYSDQVTAENETFSCLAEVMTQENDFVIGTGTETVGYTVNGDSDDWMYGETGTKPAIYAMTPETGPGTFGFWPPQSAIDQLNKSSLQLNLKAAHLLLNYGEAQEVIALNTLSESNGSLEMRVKKSGLVPGTLTLTMTGVEGVMSVTPSGASSWAMNHLQEEVASFDYILSETLINGDAVRFLVTVDNGNYLWTDTLTKVFNGNTGTVIFTDSGDDLSGWTLTGEWGLSTSTNLSSPSSYACAPGGDYSADQNSSITLSEPLDLSSADSLVLSYYALWNIENDYDYTQVMASTDGVNYSPLCGNYTSPGGGFQLLDEPLYDGRQDDWVFEEMSLDDYAGEEEVWIRFTFVSDGLVQVEGFYFDDLSVNGVFASNGCVEDLNGDGLVDISDFLIFNSAFGDTCADCPADFNGDGVVDVADFLIFNSAFGSECGG